VDQELTAPVDSVVVSELAELRRRLPELAGSVLGTLDGLLVAHDWPHPAPDAVAALAATHVGLAQRFTETAGIGVPQETLVEGLHGCVATYPVAPHLVLIVLARTRTNLARMHLEARRCAARLQDLAAADAVTLPVAPDTSARRHVPEGRLAQRVPMATLDRAGAPRPADEPGVAP
jgi:hypothetical protein